MYCDGECKHNADAMEFACVVNVVFWTQMFGIVHFVGVFAFGDEEVDESNECHATEKCETGGKHGIVGVSGAKTL